MTLSFQARRTSWIHGPKGTYLSCFIFLVALALLAVHLYAEGTNRFTFALLLAMLCMGVGNLVASKMCPRNVPLSQSRSTRTDSSQMRASCLRTLICEGPWVKMVDAMRSRHSIFTRSVGDSSPCSRTSFAAKRSHVVVLKERIPDKR